MLKLGSPVAGSVVHPFLDIWSRKIVAWGVHDEQCGWFAAELLEATCDSLGVCAEGIVRLED